MAAALWVERQCAAASAAGKAWAPVARRLGPLAAVASADVLNVTLVRRAEWQQGVAVRVRSRAQRSPPPSPPPFHLLVAPPHFPHSLALSHTHSHVRTRTHRHSTQTASGETVGSSRVAGALGVAACVAGRVAAAAPILTLPPLLLHAAEGRSPWLRARPGVATALLMAGVGLSIQVFVPLTFGLFRQTAAVPAAWLEKDVADRCSPGRASILSPGLGGAARVALCFARLLTRSLAACDPTRAEVLSYNKGI